MSSGGIRDVSGWKAGMDVLWGAGTPFSHVGKRFGCSGVVSFAKETQFYPKKG